MWGGGWSRQQCWLLCRIGRCWRFPGGRGVSHQSSFLLYLQHSAGSCSWRQWSFQTSQWCSWSGCFQWCLGRRSTRWASGVSLSSFCRGSRGVALQCFTFRRGRLWHCAHSATEVCVIIIAVSLYPDGWGLSGGQRKLHHHYQSTCWPDMQSDRVCRGRCDYPFKTLSDDGGFRGLQKSVNHDGMGDNMVRALKHVGRAASLQEVFRVSARTSLSSLT